MIYILKRRGFFATRFTTSTNQCGSEGNQFFHYRCTITTGPKLDKRGFVIDNIDIQRYFEQAYASPQPARSCEQMAKAACYELGRKMLAAGVELYDISVTILGGPNAQITATMDATELDNVAIAIGSKKPPQSIKSISDVFTTNEL